jgi:hypothetical protein
MSALTTLALMTGAVVAKLREPFNVDVEITRLQARVDDFERQLTDLERSLAESRLEADRWRALVERYQGREEQQRPAGPDFSSHHITEEMRLRLQAQHQASQLMAMAQAQQNQLMAQYHQQDPPQNAFNGLGQMTQAQALDWCNCVPARHDMFLSGRRV